MIAVKISKRGWEVVDAVTLSTEHILVVLEDLEGLEVEAEAEADISNFTLNLVVDGLRINYVEIILFI